MNICALHAINSVLQRPAFSQKSLDIFAVHMFEREQAILKTKLKNSPYHSEFGDYSIEVIEQALDLHGIKLLRVSDDDAKNKCTSLQHPLQQPLDFIAENW